MWKTISSTLCSYIHVILLVSCLRQKSAFRSWFFTFCDTFHCVLIAFLRNWEICCSEYKIPLQIMKLGGESDKWGCCTFRGTLIGWRNEPTLWSSTVVNANFAHGKEFPPFSLGLSSWKPLCQKPEMISNGHQVVHQPVMYSYG